MGMASLSQVPKGHDASLTSDIVSTSLQKSDSEQWVTVDIHIPERVEPWNSPPTRALLSKTIDRLDWLDQELVKQSSDCTSDKSYRAFQRERDRLVSWKMIANFHVTRSLGLHSEDLFTAFESFLEISKPTIASRFYHGAERDVLINNETGERYVFLRLISEAGSGTDKRLVWDCELIQDEVYMDQKQHKKVVPPTRYVIKCLMKNEKNLKENPLYYRREFIAQTIAGSFSHPNILPMVRYFETSSMVYTVLPFVDACLFDKVALQHQRFGCGFEEPLTKHLFAQMYSAVCFLGNIGLVHRDLTLENFCATSNGRVQLIDFGLALGLNLMDVDNGKWAASSWSYAGKIFYTAPEVFNGVDQSEQVDFLAADVWSLGINLYCLVAGTYPFRCASPTCEGFARLRAKGLISLMRWQIRKGDMSDIRVSDDLLDLLSRMLQVDPSKRIKIDQIRSHPFLRIPT